METTISADQVVGAFGLSNTVWVERCAAQLGRLRNDLALDHAYMLAYDLWCDGHGDSDPEVTAIREISMWSAGTLQ
jgi:hypothetical protein